jgi:ubiquinol-cytochrome c reductase iron-sulfur subunit
MSDNHASENHESPEGETRRDFMVLTASALAGIGGAATLWPFIDSMNPAADTLALASTEVDLSAISQGQSITVKWRGKPVFIRHRTEEEIAQAESVALSELPDPQTDDERIKDGKKQWLVMVGVCTHLGCVPLGEAGDFGGWFCPCHGSHYDTAGRIRKGPAPTNMAVPEFTFLNDTRIKIG